jgi:hypothetical protein
MTTITEKVKNSVCNQQVGTVKVYYASHIVYRIGETRWLVGFQALNLKTPPRGFDSGEKAAAAIEVDRIERARGDGKSYVL